MKRLIVFSLMIVPLAGCGEMVTRAKSVVTPAPEVSVGNGYRGAEDPCRRVGATKLTQPYVNETEDLVGCPVEYEGRPEFQVKTGGREVTRTQEWVIYRVPLVGEGPLPD